MARVFGIGFGVFTHALFAFLVWHIFWFLRGSVPTATAAPAAWWLIDSALALQFGVIHSLLLWPATRAWLGRYIAGAFYGCFFCVITCLCLLLTIVGWQATPFFVWNLTGWGERLTHAAYYLSWGLMIYSLCLSGLGFQTGWLPWWHWLRGLPEPRRDFTPRGLYLVLRHPVYLSVLGLIWFTPVMTYDRALLCLIWTAYIFVGSHLKDQRLVHFIGDAYRAYQAKVPGYPGMLLGPLARVPLAK